MNLPGVRAIRISASTAGEPPCTSPPSSKAPVCTRISRCIPPRPSPLAALSCGRRGLLGGKPAAAAIGHPKTRRPSPTARPGLSLSSTVIPSALPAPDRLQALAPPPAFGTGRRRPIRGRHPAQLFPVHLLDTTVSTESFTKAVAIQGCERPGSADRPTGFDCGCRHSAPWLLVVGTQTGLPRPTRTTFASLVHLTSSPTSLACSSSTTKGGWYEGWMIPDLASRRAAPGARPRPAFGTITRRVSSLS